MGSDPAFGDYYRQIFLALGLNSLVVATYAAGLACLKSAILDFIVVDQGSPAFEGRSILERAMEVDRHTSILVVAHCRDMGCYLEAMQLGAVDYLDEPPTVPEMLRVVTTHLRLRAGLTLEANVGLTKARTGCRDAVNELIDVLGRATVEATHLLTTNPPKRSHP